MQNECGPVMTKMSKLVDGKLAFITGAGSGIGRAICQILAREGAKVVATDRNIKTAQETVATLDVAEHIALNVDVTDRENIEKAFKDVTKQFSKAPTIIVNSAGITQIQPLMKFSDKDFDNLINVNLKGTFLIMQTAIKTLMEANVTEGSSIVNVSSIVSKDPSIGQSIYSASKAGIVAMTKSASMELGKFGIRVNAVLPGIIQTPMVAPLPDNVKEMFLEKVSLKRMGKSEEVAEVILFLSSNRSSYVNGAAVEITGGM